MTVLRMDHVGIVVEDLAAATEFFAELGLERGGEASVEGELADRVVGLDGVRSDVVFMRTPDGHSQLELSQFRSPPNRGGNGDPPANAPGIRHLTFAVDDINAIIDRLRGRGAELVGELVNYEDSYWLCYLRGPDGIIIELAEKVG
jgi:catechol 2,3-dioxygenase-like lactoylglutathione lyase family enzyme